MITLQVEVSCLEQRRLESKEGKPDLGPIKLHLLSGGMVLFHQKKVPVLALSKPLPVPLLQDVSVLTYQTPPTLWE